MSAFIRPCPESISAAVMELVDKWKRGEIEPDEYNRRFTELQAEAKREEIQKENA